MGVGFPSEDMEDGKKTPSGGDSEASNGSVGSEQNAHDKENKNNEEKKEGEKDSDQQQNGVENIVVEESEAIETSNDSDALKEGDAEDTTEDVASENDCENDDGCDVEPPSGWKRIAKRLNADNSEGKIDVCYVSPQGKRLCSAHEVRTYCEEQNIDIDLSKFIFSYTEKNSPKTQGTDQVNGRSNSNSPTPDNHRSVSPPSGSSSVLLCEQTSDSQTSSESAVSSTKKLEKRQISTSALLRAYRPHQKGNNRTSNSSKPLPAAAAERTPSLKRKLPDQAEASTNASETAPSLVLECKSDALSAAQASKIQKVQEEISRLQLLLWNGVESGDKNGTAPLVNGTVGSSPTLQVGQPLTNGTSLVGLQVPQFLLFQNGQMVGATSITPSSQTVSTSPGTPSTVTTTRTNAFAASKPVAPKPAQDKTTVSTTRPQRPAKPTAPANSRNSPDIQVLREMRVPTHVQGTPGTGPTQTTTTSTTPAVSSTKTVPLLGIVCRPKNTLSPSASMSFRKELDAKVKSVLVKSPQEFVEWLLSEGLIRTAQFCSIHKLQPSQMPYKLKLGMFSDPKVLATSGGYVWISECCGKKYVSAYSGSIFGSTPIDKVPPTAVLKLVYHWACQTSISNVESWVKVDKTFINKIFNYLRCVCSVMLQDKVYDFGFDGTTVELGIVSLGTSTADGTKKAVKVEILGLYDRKMKSYRLFASEPEPGSSSRQRFVRILRPLERVVHNNAIILCDQSVDRNCLYNMNYGKVSVCETSDNEDNLQSNAKIMSYLRKHVPKMFQSTLSQLSLEQVQIVLDELCWRERFGHCAAHAYNTMIEHITYLTAREAENPGVLHLLDFVAKKPHHNWRYKSQHLPKMLPALQPSIIMSTPTSGTINPQVTVDIAVMPQSPLEHNNKVPLTPRKGPTQRETTQPIPAVNTTPPSTTSTISPKPDAVELEPFYYGQIQGDLTLGREVNNYTFTCHLCNDTYSNNIEFYTHLKSHLGSRHPSLSFCCDYCSEHFGSQETRDHHQKFRHLQMDTRYTWCRICTESFPGEFQLVNHMAKKHYESELPYRCEVCNFTTSIYFSVINHFKVEHKDSPYVQCHFCLSVKTINSSSASSFSFRMLQHLQKHANQQGKCKSCALSFYSKYLLDEHKRKDHVSRANVTGLQRYKVPVGHNRIMFRPYVKRGTASNMGLVQLQPSNTVALSQTLQRLDSLTLDIGTDDKKYYCIECDASLSLDQHFKAYQKCTKCPYSTCCRSMLSKHAQVFHPNGKQKSGYYRIGPPIILPRPMYCICGFSTCSGNHLARHLALCEGGRKSAYPSLMDAMVYRGDPMTPSALALSSLGLQRMLPGSVTPTLPHEDSLDMSHFMSMSMEVDEETEDDPPIMPLSVELSE